jgi:hypothetical protein
MAGAVRIGVTGHTRLTDRAAEVVYEALVRQLRWLGAGAAIVGVTCLATGADQVFARAVLAVGGHYEVVLPAPGYGQTLAPAHRAAFYELLAAAGEVIHTGQQVSAQPAYTAASQIMLGRVHRLMAVWDGDTRGTPGGTADVVAAARLRGVATTVVWPAGAART